MDLDGDGNNDILSGCYSVSGHDVMVGLFHVLRGNDDGTFQTAEPLKGTDGELLMVHHQLDDRSNQLTENICTRPFATDWDGDGDLDLVVGNFKGTFFVFTGEGGGKFQPVPAQLTTADGETLKTGGVHSDPFIIDWDGDGDLDLLASSHTGEIVWSENLAISGDNATGTGASGNETGAPASAYPAKLSAFRTLIAPPGQPSNVMRGSAEYHEGITAAYELLDEEKFDEAEAAFTKVIEMNPQVGDGWYHLACAHTRRAATLEGTAQEVRLQMALAMLTRAFTNGWANFTHMKSDPDMAVLRERDDYQAMVAKHTPGKPVGPAGSVRIHVADFDGDGKLDILAGDRVTVGEKRTGQVWLYRQK